MGIPAYSISSHFVKVIVELAEQCSVSRSELLRDSGISEQQLNDASYRFSVKDCAGLVALAEALSDKPSFSLYVGQSVRPGMFSSLGYTIMSAKTVEDAVRLNKKFGVLIANIGRIAFNITPTTASCLLTAPKTDAELLRPFNEMFVTAWWVYGQWMIGGVGKLKKVVFSHAEPSYREEYEKIFQAPVFFSQAHNGFIFDHHYLGVLIKQSDSGLHSMLKEKIIKQVAAAAASTSLSQKVSNSISILLIQHKANLKTVASYFKMSERGLRRKLQDENTSFQVLLQTVRRQKAQEYLKEGRSVLNTALSLGYKDQSAFTNAFRKWFQCSPTEYKESK